MSTSKIRTCKSFNIEVFVIIKHWWMALELTMSFPALNTIYKIVHSAEPQTNMPTTFHFYSVNIISFWDIYRGCRYVTYMKSMASLMWPRALMPTVNETMTICDYIAWIQPWNKLVNNTIISITISITFCHNIISAMMCHISL